MPGPTAVLGQLLEGRNVRLQPPGARDYPVLYALALQDEVGSRWLGERALSSLHRFEQAVEEYQTRFVVYARNPPTPVGLVALRNLDAAEGHATVGALAPRDAQGIDLALQGAVLFIEYAFAVLQLRKLYIELPDTATAIPVDVARGFAAEEGRLRRHLYHQGSYIDLLILAIHREQWDEASLPVLEAIQDLGG